MQHLHAQNTDVGGGSCMNRKALICPDKNRLTSLQITLSLWAARHVSEIHLDVTIWIF